MEDIKCYLYELLKGIKALKDIGIYHRDVKPGNFLYNPDTREGSLIDFGLSELVISINKYDNISLSSNNISFYYLGPKFRAKIQTKNAARTRHK